MQEIAQKGSKERKKREKKREKKRKKKKEGEVRMRRQETKKEQMKKTKIICTMGPTTSDRAVMKSLAESGMDVARFNFSHGSHEEHKERMDMLKSVREEVGRPIAILLDTKGPEIRTGLLKDGKKVTLEQGQAFTLTTEDIVGDEKCVSISYDGLVEDVKRGNRILIDDGLIELEVINSIGSDIVCEVLNGGELGQRKGVNVPNVPVKLPALTQKDRDDIRFGVEQGIDFIAASFVRSAEGIIEIKRLLKECKAPHIPIIAKIENGEGIKNIDEILNSADGIMVAHGDLGVEIPAHELPYLQKLLIQKCNDAYKPVITATQMLDYMMRNPRPTRAEVTDVANAVFDGTDAVMLSGETANGKYPVEALNMMVQIVKNAENHLDYEALLSKRRENRGKSISCSIGYSSVATAMSLNAKCIITPSASGITPRIVSKFKPEAMIVGVTPNEETMRRMQIYRGVYPIKTIPHDSTEEMVEDAVELTKVKGLVEIGDIVVVTAGIPSTKVNSSNKGITNMMRVAVVD